MALIIREMIKQYNFLVYDLADPRTQSWPLIGNPFPVIGIILLYVYFVQVVGPRWMANRPAFKLDRMLQVYNVIQIVVSLWMVERCLVLGWFNKYNYFCQPIDWSDDPEALEVAGGCYYFFLIKLMDLMDTVFFVLRKKNNQITFLHVYHHAGMVAGVWGGTKYLPGGHGTFLGFVNSVVHSIMYTYYLITSIYPQHKKNIWWKKHITQMQMVQFAMITLHTVQLLFQPNCTYPKWFVFLIVPQNAFMFVLFYDFYRKAYFPKKPLEPAQNKID